MRYGSIDPKSNKSFVELEYEAAIEKQLDVHLYLIDEEKAALAPIFVDRDENATKLSDFKELLRKRHTVESFITPEDLSQKVERDLLRQFRERNLVVEGGKLLPVSEVEKALDLIERFDVMPGRLSGKQVEIVVKFEEKPEMVSQEDCTLLDLQFGRSLERRVKVMHPEKASKVASFMNKLYAEYDMADFVYEAASGKEFKVLTRLVFGTTERRSFVTNKEPRSPYHSVSTFDLLAEKPEPYVDLESGQHFYNYTTKHKIMKKGLVLVRPL